MKKKVYITFGCLFLFFFMIFVKVYFSSMKEFKTAEIAFSKNEYRLAIRHYERAILWYLPVGGYVEPAAKQLWQLAGILETKDEKLALEAYRSLRSAFYATRSFYTPGQPWIDKTNPKIAYLMAKETIYSEADREKTIAQKTKEALVILERPMKPDPFWSIILEIGFLGWVSGVLVFIWRAFRNEKGEILSKQGILWGTVIVFFYALWIIGMVKA